MFLSSLSRASKIAIPLSIMAAVALLFAIPAIDRLSATRDFKGKMRGSPPLSEKIRLYKTLLARVGAVDSQRILLESAPIDSITHMVNHESGKYLYTSEGFAGVKKCTIDFADSCYHGFISAVVQDTGLTDLPSLLNACTIGTTGDQKLQCAHGLGHGFLENVDYRELPQALQLCFDTFGSDKKAAAHCYEGVIMENNFGEFTVAPADRWVKSDDPMYPCNTPEVRVFEGAHDYCWYMQSQSTLRHEQYPMFDGIGAVATYCESIRDPKDRGVCFMGLARQLQVKNHNDISQVRTDCREFGAKREAQCLFDALQAAYIYGDRGDAFPNICESAAVEDRDACYDALAGAIVISYYEKKDRVKACDTIQNESYKQRCSDWVVTPEADNY